jgi:uncharacterized protein YjbI with pentapeptide repeats
MPECRYFEVCGRNADEGTEGDLCILHSRNPTKDTKAFAEALADHRNGGRRNNFSAFVFPGPAIFIWDTFAEEVNFSRSIFIEGADFNETTFAGAAFFDYAEFGVKADFALANFGKNVFFRNAKFAGGAFFSEATFAGDAIFTLAKFTRGDAYFGASTFVGVADFSQAKLAEDVPSSFRRTTFSNEAHFRAARFAEKVNFGEATFAKGADFSQASFTKGATFNHAEFRGRTLFSGGSDGGRTLRVFANAEVEFRDVMIEPLDALVLRDADLTKCRFKGTDLRKAEITGAQWPELTRRFWFLKWKGSGVYDEQAAEDKTHESPHIERLYRELKQNYDDRRDYERSGDFHYGEKEMLRIDPETPRRWKFVLGVYVLVSGYGEKCLRPLFSAGVILVLSTVLYLLWGLCPKDGGRVLNSVWDLLDWRVWNYSLRVVTFLKPDDWVPLGHGPLVNTFASLLGPVLIGFFALALRQRLKR